MSDNKRSPTPPGAMIELNLADIDEGKLVAQVQRKLRRPEIHDPLLDLAQCQARYLIFAWN